MGIDITIALNHTVQKFGEEKDMSANTVYCHVLGSNVSVISDLNGRVTNVICPEFARLTHSCMIKYSKSGGIAHGFKRAMDRMTDTRNSHCEFVDTGDSPITKFVEGLFE